MRTLPVFCFIDELEYLRLIDSGLNRKGAALNKQKRCGWVLTYGYNASYTSHGYTGSAHRKRYKQEPPLTYCGSAFLCFYPTLTLSTFPSMPVPRNTDAVALNMLTSSLT